MTLRTAEPDTTGPAAVRFAALRSTAGRAVHPRLLPPGAVLALAAYLRFHQLTAVGFNSDEAVYTGSALGLTGDHALESMFPIFRAHPILVQLIVAQALRISDTDWSARAVTAGFGVLAVALTYLLGRRLYGTAAGLAAAGLLAVMPYHVVVSREVLLDGPMACFGVLGLYCLVRAAEDAPRRWVAAAGAALGLAALSKETAVVLLGGVFAFGVVGAAGRLRPRHLPIGLGVFVVVFSAYPLGVKLGGASSTGQNFLLWQLLRRANHPFWFYFSTLPMPVGPAVLALAALGLYLLRSRLGWRERLLLAWIAVPLLFFTVWPVKGYQYLLPAAPALAVLAGVPIGLLWAARKEPDTSSAPADPESLNKPRNRPPLRSWAGRRLDRPDQLDRLDPLDRLSPPTRRALLAAAAPILALAAMTTLLVPTWQDISPSTSTAFLAGTGGLPGGRATGQWIAAHLPQGAQLLAAGPSIANVLEFYGGHKVGALSVSTDPRDRNPVYQPVPNPDLAVRTGEYQYLVWDSYTAARTPYFAADLRKLVQKYHGVAVYTATVQVGTAIGDTPVPVIIVYEVHP